MHTSKSPIIDCIKLKVQTIGEGEPLLAIHGVLGSGDNLRLLGKLPCQVHLPDLRNHGDSPNHADASLLAMSHDLLSYLDEQGIEKTHLLGHSLGARLAMFLAINFPDRINKLVAVDMVPRSYPSHQKSILDGMEQVELAQVQSRQQADDILAQNIPEPSIRQFILKSLYRLPAGDYAWKIGWQYLREDYESWGCSPVHEQQICFKEGAFIYGMDSSFVQLSDHPIMRKHFPALEIIGIEGAGHWVHAQQPQRFLQEVQRVLFA